MGKFQLSQKVDDSLLPVQYRARKQAVISVNKPLAHARGTVPVIQVLSEI